MNIELSKCIFYYYVTYTKSEHLKYPFPTCTSLPIHLSVLLEDFGSESKPYAHPLTEIADAVRLSMVVTAPPHFTKHIHQVVLKQIQLQCGHILRQLCELGGG